MKSGWFGKYYQWLAHATNFQNRKGRKGPRLGQDSAFPPKVVHAGTQREARPEGTPWQRFRRLTWPAAFTLGLIGFIELVRPQVVGRPESEAGLRDFVGYPACAVCALAALFVLVWPETRRMKLAAIAANLAFVLYFVLRFP